MVSAWLFGSCMKGFSRKKKLGTPAVDHTILMSRLEQKVESQAQLQVFAVVWVFNLSERWHSAGFQG